MWRLPPLAAAAPRGLSYAGSRRPRRCSFLRGWPGQKQGVRGEVRALGLVINQLCVRSVLGSAKTKTIHAKEIALDTGEERVAYPYGSRAPGGCRARRDAIEQRRPEGTVDRAERETRARDRTVGRGRGPPAARPPPARAHTHARSRSDLKQNVKNIRACFPQPTGPRLSSAPLSDSGLTSWRALSTERNVERVSLESAS